MSESQAETFSIHNIIVLFGLLLAAVFIGEVLIGPHSDDATMAEAMDSVDDIAMRVKPVVTLEDIRSGNSVVGLGGGGGMSVAAGAADSAPKSPAELYQGACLACHTTGAAGAPKIGDAAAWSARSGKGLDALVSSAVNGIGAMPPRGGSQLSDEQIHSVVEYILGESQ